MKKRLFIAIDIPDGVRQMAADHTARLSKRFTDPRISWTKPGNLHLTIKFLGDVEESRIYGLCSALEKAAAGMTGFDVAIRGTGVFPSARRPNVFWLGVENAGGELRRLAAVTEERLTQIGFAKEDRKFSPHLTIGRVRAKADASDVALDHLESRFESPKFPVVEVVLYDSKLSPGGSIYAPICTAKLK